ncbi:MAG: polymer-forming cytoskeletal protein [Deltaproteobacteria bacterium]|nr:polymer-forming cytoskeletal protein [Deltaproteobacteria bacterium]MBW2016634.1 polymer-forming cytoskeletal protein [Deltaproteobacteria bacterium]MBW2130120.1 polymer-forming cytoskeletal protein [Deltaproteobacteria bacterium]MBW2303742.1 polymer-forming cytoskeletal protein [Deltaproteobacteria bacterium]
MKKNKQVVTFLGKDTEFEGRLNFNGSIRIDGHFKGEIHSDGNLIVGEEGMIEADMHVGFLVIRGEVHGNIIADQRVDIRAPGKVFGNVQAPTVVIDEGVIFEGQTRMYQARAVQADSSDVVDSAQYAGGPPQNLTAIYGVISEEGTGKPIRNAEVRVKGDEKKETQSNASGYYELIHLRDGKWKVKVKAKGYRKVESVIEISGGGAHKQDFALQPKKGRKEPPREIPT